MEELERRKKKAISAIQNVFGTEEDEDGATLFVTHHLEEIEEEYWRKHLGKSKPEPKEVLDILVLESHWGDENSDGMDTLDFTLPGNVTDYLISVSFDEVGNVEEITMES
ncbi:MAG TPA: DUF2004 domain-containing protein [Planctomycetes bacterium]|nr:DUF2004 domain-containing protein [Planctomycetota bacterium]